MEKFTLWIVILLDLTCSLAAEYPAEYPSNKQKNISFACEDSFVNLQCKEGHIRVLLANYGRFSLYICGMKGIDRDWNVQCSAKDSIRIVSEKCDGRKICSFQAANHMFGGDPCPGTTKYLEVQFYCEKDDTTSSSTTTQSTTTTTATTTSTISKSTLPFNLETTPESEVTTVSQGQDKKPGRPICPAQEMAGVKWPPTQNGQTRKVKCPIGMSGDAVWQCGEKGSWLGPPDLTNCVSEWMTDINDAIDSDMPVEKAVTSLNANIRGRELHAGDLKKATTHLIPELVRKLKMQMTGDKSSASRDMVHRFNKEIVKSTSSLLDSSQSKSWQTLDSSTRKMSATSLIVSLEQMALEVAATLNTSDSISSCEQNIVMEVSVLKLRQVHSPILRLPTIQRGVAKDDGYRDFSLPLDSVIGLENTDDVTVTYLFYNNIEALMSPGGDETGTKDGADNSSMVINSKVISASVSKHSETGEGPVGKTLLSRPMTFTLSHNERLKDKVPVCAYWDFSKSTLVGKWSTDGCRVVKSNDAFTTCECNHLTNFAILMDVSGTKLDRFHVMSLQAITYVGCTVSIVCLFMCFVSFSIFRNLESDRNTIHKNLVFCLMIAELLFLFGIGQTDSKVGCSVIAGFLHFFFLCSFSWMCLEGIQLYFMLIEVFEAERSRVRWFYLFGYGVPALIVGISAAVDHTGYGTEAHCWLRTDNYFILSFVVPAAVVVMINIVMLGIAISMMCRHAGVTASAIQARQKGKLEKIATWLKGSAVLVVLLGLTWIFGFMYVNADTVAIAYMFTILNSLQGLFIFIFHCFMDRKVKKEWRRAIYKARWLPVCCRVNLGGYQGNVSSPTPTSSSGNYFMRFWSGRKRKRSDGSATGSANGKRRSNLDSYLISDSSSGCTVRTALNRYSNQSDKLLPNGQNVYSAMPTHFEGENVNDLSIQDCSVIDSEFVSEYCQNNLRVINEKREYSSGSESDDDKEKKLSKSVDSINKDRLSLLSKDSMAKVHSEFTSDNEESKLNLALSNQTYDPSGDGDTLKRSDSERNCINNLLSMYMSSEGERGVHNPAERMSTSQQKLDSLDRKYIHSNTKMTKSAPDLKLASRSVNQNDVLDSTTEPLLGTVSNDTDVVAKVLDTKTVLESRIE
ncbi:adhesion G protein-coupled receptor L3-like isoform X2 [Dreissena polymorpha]|uniref:adhesion G protein-coupled receptor L3-like isoform X2 n=1 Tax=Dreissena polymorpha TaxID=45954 RepID=UPI0022653EAD|nr:adhesion G protein-coupled receptor L3-like isoform X2 [Dreissena polymorpha]